MEIIKSNDNSAALFCFLLMKKIEEKLMALRDEVANHNEYRELTASLNNELKEVLSLIHI